MESCVQRAAKIGILERGPSLVGLVELQLHIFRWLHGALVVLLVSICLRCGGLCYNFNTLTANKWIGQLGRFELWIRIRALNARMLNISQSAILIKKNKKCELRVRAAYEQRANCAWTTSANSPANYAARPSACTHVAHLLCSNIFMGAISASSISRFSCFPRFVYDARAGIFLSKVLVHMDQFEGQLTPVGEIKAPSGWFPSFSIWIGQ